MDKSLIDEIVSICPEVNSRAMETTFKGVEEYTFWRILPWYCKLNEDFILCNLDKLDQEGLIETQELSLETIEKIKDKNPDIWWKNVVKFQQSVPLYLGEEIIKDKLIFTKEEWTILLNNRILDKSELRKYEETLKVIGELVIINQLLPEDFIEEFLHTTNSWSIKYQISKYQKMSPEFIRRNINDLIGDAIIEHNIYTTEEFDQELLEYCSSKVTPTKRKLWFRKAMKKDRILLRILEPFPFLKQRGPYHLEVDNISVYPNPDSGFSFGNDTYLDISINKEDILNTGIIFGDSLKIIDHKPISYNKWKI